MFTRALAVVGMQLREVLTLGVAAAVAAASVACWATYKKPKIVPYVIEQDVRDEMGGDDEVDLVDGEGNLTHRVGASLRVAKEVKLRFGGTPKYSEANKLLAARYIDEALTEHGVTRKIDRARMMYKIRALVFTRLKEEREEDQWVNSTAAQDSHEYGTGWATRAIVEMFGLRATSCHKLRRRTPTVA